ncbi:MAG: RNA polymerase sigma factor RpoE [Gammaproteobacteria bacterium]|nr:RNA polymerase sigma factor RpoE [Gammaproteobacteria bacterium]MDD9874160.1 RNA polymerase sigma factor RpoE [Gammaproteobacteria bacterium]
MEDQGNDNILVARVRNGDKQAFNLLVAKYQYRIRSLVSRLVADPLEQEDIVQDAFIKAYRAISRFRGDSAFYTWLYRIAVNTAKHHLVNATRRPPMQDIDAGDMAPMRTPPRLVEDNTPEMIRQNDQLVQTIKRAIDELPEELRQAITLRELEGLSYEDIAEAMNCPIGTVRSRIFRAREAIQQAMEPLLD